jgi:hypothetical protein
MSFGKLLSVGKGFLGGCKSIAYRENKRVYLPKFNAAKNPFVPKAEEKKPVLAPASVPAPQKTAKTVVAATTPVTMKARKAQVFAVQKPLAATAATSWAERLNPFRSPAPSTPVVRPVQTELSLDAVKVLHNDLSDADVEVVPVKSRTAAPVESPRLLPTRGSLEFFGERQLEAA